MSDQISLFDDGDSGEDAQPERLGNANIEYRPTSSALTRASGFMADYDYTLNPYMGCAFACTYCYAASFARSQDLRDSWGSWVVVKNNAVEKLKRMRTDLRDKTIYMSSVTDPYQLVERRLELVRELLEILAERGARLVVQTRSPLVLRDIDIFLRFEHVRINMTVTTDSEEVRKVFEPQCPPNAARIAAIKTIHESGLPASITMTPLLPLDNAADFANQLAATGITDFVVQPFHADRGQFVAGTREPAMAILRAYDWDAARYGSAVGVLRSVLPNLTEGREGFRPE